MECKYEENIEIWKIQRMIKNLANARGNGTSMISLVMPPTEDLHKINQMLTNEFGTASNIKSRVNRLSVLSAIKSTQERLKLYNKMPLNGLVIFCGTILTENNKEKKVTIDFEPFKPINKFLYLCDNRFHTEPLNELLISEEKYGFIIIDGNGTLFGKLAGSNKEILQDISVELPKKHGRGGQSAMRFARLRLEKRHNYLVKISELSVKHFITDDKINVSGLIVAGSAEFKQQLTSKDLLDPRLQNKIISVLDIAYGGNKGFEQAIELSQESLGNLKFIQEKNLLQNYMDEINQDTGKYCFGINDTIYALESGAIDKLLCYQDLELYRVKVKNNINEEETKFLSIETRNTLNLNEFEILDEELFVDWISQNYNNFGCELYYISNYTTEGSQFCRGFGGIGAILRYPIEFNDYNLEEEDLEEDLEIDYEDCFI